MVLGRFAPEIKQQVAKPHKVARKPSVIQLIKASKKLQTSTTNDIKKQFSTCGPTPEVFTLHLLH